MGRCALMDPPYAFGLAFNVHIHAPTPLQALVSYAGLGVTEVVAMPW